MNQLTPYPKIKIVFAIMLGGLVLQGCESCSEKAYPEEVATGVARLSVRNFARLIEAIQTLPARDNQTECQFDNLNAGELDTISEGRGTLTLKFADCEFDFGSDGKANKDAKLFGKVKISGTRTISGLLTENSEFPIIPSGVEFNFTKVIFDNFRVESPEAKETLTIIRGNAAFKALIHLAKKKETLLCDEPLPNITLTNIRYFTEPGSRAALMRLPGPRGEFEVEVQGSDFQAQVGVHKELFNHLDGEMTVWGKKVKVPKGSSELIPELKREDYEKSIESLEPCRCEADIAATVAQLTVLDLSMLVRQLVLENRAPHLGRACHLGSFEDSPIETKWREDHKHADVTWAFNACVYDLNDHPDFAGKVTVSGQRVAYGRPTQSAKFPFEPKGDIHFHFSRVQFDSFRLKSADTSLLHGSDSISFDLVIPQDESPALTKPAIRNIRYLEKKNLVLSKRTGDLKGDFKFAVEDSDFHAEMAKDETRGSIVDGRVKMFGDWIEFGPRTIEAPELPASPQIEPMCPDVSELSSEEIRAFFADMLDAPHGEKQSDLARFKATLVRHSDALYRLSHRPELLSNAGVPQSLESWTEGFSERLKKIPQEDFKEVLIAMDEDEVGEFLKSVEEGIADFKIEGFDGLSSIQIPEALGHDFSAFLKNVLEQYFPELDIADKKRVFASLMRNTTSQSDDVEKLLAMVYGAGPFFQKIIQLLGDKLEPGPLKEGLSNVKSRLPRIDRYDIAQYIKELEERGVKLDDKMESLGAASVGEAFLTTRLVDGAGPNRQLVIKFMRPGVMEIAKREHVFLHRQASAISDVMRKSYEKIAEQIFAELDFKKEMRNLRLGGKFYGSNDFPAITVVKPIEDFPEGEHWIAMEYGKGKTFRDARGDSSDKRSAKLELLSKGLLLEMLTMEFIRKSFFMEAEGFFHGDLHEGNILLAMDEVAVEAWLNENKITDQTLSRAHVEKLLRTKNQLGETLIRLILVDFGNAHEVDKFERNALFNVFISASDVSMSGAAFLASFQALSPESVLDVKKLQPQIDAFFKDEEMKFAEKIARALNILQKDNVFIPGIVSAFYRSVDLLGNAYQQLREDAATQNLCFQNLTIIAPMRDEMVKKLVGEAIWRLGQAGLRLGNAFFGYSDKPEENYFWPVMLNPENVEAMGPVLPRHTSKLLYDWTWESLGITGKEAPSSSCELSY